MQLTINQLALAGIVSSIMTNNCLQFEFALKEKTNLGVFCGGRSLVLSKSFKSNGQFCYGIAHVRAVFFRES